MGNGRGMRLGLLAAALAAALGCAKTEDQQAAVDACKKYGNGSEQCKMANRMLASGSGKVAQALKAEEQAKQEAQRRWGKGGAVSARPPPANESHGGRGRLARYRFSVGNHGLGKACTVKGMGHSWREAFEDAREQTWME